jgi:hypothetical protein
MKALKPYKYKKMPGQFERRQVNRAEAELELEQLTGQVNGQRASDLEERFARALEKIKGIRRYDFQPSMIVDRNLPGEVRPDFIIYSDTPMAVMIDGEFVHKSAEARARDQFNDAILYEHLRDFGFLPPIRVPGYRLQTQDEANAVAQDLIYYGRLV